MPNIAFNHPQSRPNSIGSKHRLAEISHHFLSDENERSPAWKNTAIVPVLLGSKHDDYIAHELNRSFNRQSDNQNCSMVLNIENSLTTSGAPHLSPETNEQRDDYDHGGMPDYCLVPVISPPTTMALQSDRLIIAVHTSLGGVRIAYDQLAFMASLNTDFNVCVIMLEAKNIQDAKRFFGFLCNNAQSLLALELECGGFLLQDNQDATEHGDSAANYSTANPSTRNSATTISNDHDIPTDLEGVAKRVLKKLAPNIKSMTAASLSSPMGAAGLLS